MPAHPTLSDPHPPLATTKPDTLWRTVFEQSRLGIVLIDPATDRILDLNQRFADLAGRPRESLRGQDWMHLTHPEDLAHEVAHKTQLREGRLSCFLRDKRYVHPDGTVLWVHVNETRVTVAEGEPPCFLAMVEDITEQRQTRLDLHTEREASVRRKQDRALRQTQDLLHMAEQAAGAGAWDWDLHTDQLNWSPAMFRLFGLDPQCDPAKFDTWRTLVHPDDLSAAELALEESIRDRRPFVASYRIVQASGEVRWIDAYGQVSHDANGVPVHFSGLCIDATLRHHTESQIRQLNAELESKVEARTAELAQANAALHRLARHDVLTGLPNRLAANERLREELLRMKRSKLPYAVLMIDVDHFKRVNDQHGHAVGDQVLQRVSQCLRGPLRESDFVSRFGGEEFLILLPHTDEAGACLVAEKLRQAVESAPDPTAGLVTISVGLAMAAPTQDDQDAPVQMADARLYAAKQGGRNRVVHRVPAHG
ncbi:MAG: diguanylate cyclase [Aquabacterium sp.]|jgi:diguanylate cyclase (GGDEF)-like protein/PAS domain S-box-containing protein|uniref:GGDEF domain-containing protein n=1 Tax=Aquabacterium sp. TaxID=1872578 RepID=UPI002A36AE7D|nr:diguanylate cyclase [Aquabacterium sp.]MDX9844413.1 diguanylate cyclase [Aquabacterium sp.]